MAGRSHPVRAEARPPGRAPAGHPAAPAVRAKTLVAKAVTVAQAQEEGQDIAATLAEAVSALDRAAKAGAIHPNAAARRKSRLTRKVNAAVGGNAVVRRPRREEHGKAAGDEGRQGPHRRRQGDEGEGRADRGRQGPRGAVEDDPRRDRRSGGRGRGDHRPAPKTTKAPAKVDDEGSRLEVDGDEGQGEPRPDRQGRARRRPPPRRPPRRRPKAKKAE